MKQTQHQREYGPQGTASITENGATVPRIRIADGGGAGRMAEQGWQWWKTNVPVWRVQEVFVFRRYARDTLGESGVRLRGAAPKPSTSSGRRGRTGDRASSALSVRDRMVRVLCIRKGRGGKGAGGWRRAAEGREDAVDRALKEGVRARGGG